MAKDITIGNMESSKYDPNSKRKEVAFNDEVVKNTGNQTIAGTKTFSSSPIVPTPTSDMEVATKKYVDDNAGGNPNLFKYSIVTSVNSGNLTVALKNYLGTDPSATTPVKVQIGDTIRTITSALSVTLAAGGNWLNLGSSELATKEVDLFVYLYYSTTNAAVGLGYSRYPAGNKSSDFNTANDTSEKSIPRSIPNNTTDSFVNIGRFNAILSAGPSYTWSLGTGPIINSPIYETRWLDYIPQILNSTMTWVQGIARALYKIQGDTIYLNIQDNYSNIGGTVEKSMSFSIPFTVTQTPASGTLFENGVSIFECQYKVDPTTIVLEKSSPFVLGQGGIIRLNGNSRI